MEDKVLASRLRSFLLEKRVPKTNAPWESVYGEVKGFGGSLNPAILLWKNIGEANRKRVLLLPADHLVPNKELDNVVSRWGRHPSKEKDGSHKEIEIEGRRFVIYLWKFQHIPSPEEERCFVLETQNTLTGSRYAHLAKRGHEVLWFMDWLRTPTFLFPIVDGEIGYWPDKRFKEALIAIPRGHSEARPKDRQVKLDI